MVERHWVRVTARVLLIGTLVWITWQSLVPADQIVASTANDKVNHLVAYGALGVLAALSVPRDRWWAAWIRVSALGLMIEAAQSLTPYRAFEWMDFVADAAGAAIGVGIAALVRRTALKPSTR